VVDQVRASCCDAVGVVLGAHAARIALELEGSEVVLLENHAWEEGIASSVRTAATWAASQNASAVRGGHLNRLVDAN
jgi:CTP:molybdopterin cytidylyltransferase MocA